MVVLLGTKLVGPFISLIKPSKNVVGFSSKIYTTKKDFCRSPHPSHCVPTPNIGIFAWFSIFNIYLFSIVLHISSGSRSAGHSAHSTASVWETSSSWGEEPCKQTHWRCELLPGAGRWPQTTKQTTTPRSITKQTRSGRVANVKSRGRNTVMLRAKLVKC